MMATAGQPTIRHARREDVDVILQFIRELAEYEQDLKSVEATRDDLLSTIAFAPSGSSSGLSLIATVNNIEKATEPITPTRPARCYLVFPPEGGGAVGMALYFYNYSTWAAKPGIYLEDFYVQPNQRGKGYGKKLLVTLAREVLQLGGARLDWSVLTWNDPSIAIYKAIGGKQQDKWHHYRADGEALIKLAGMEK